MISCNWWRAMLAAAAALCATSGMGGAVRFEHLPDRLRIWIGDRECAEYRHAEERFPSIYPLIGPTGMNVLRRYPFEEREGEPKDHPHHRGLWFTHGDVNGHDFWSSKHGERIVHVTYVGEDAGRGEFCTSNHWVAGGTVVAADTRVWRFEMRENGNLAVDLMVTIYSAGSDVVFGDTKEGSFALRLAPALQADPPGSGEILNAAGQTGKDAWSRRAPWCDYRGALGGDLIGVSIFDHPSNPRHPTGWHVRTYGLYAANPFAAKSFGMKEDLEPLRVPVGGAMTFRWRVFLRRGEMSAEAIDREYRHWVGER